jgi:heme/copper-type cytochrome/quinol oxidase subunit 2
MALILLLLLVIVLWAAVEISQSYAAAQQAKAAVEAAQAAQIASAGNLVSLVTVALVIVAVLVAVVLVAWLLLRVRTQTAPQRVGPNARGQVSQPNVEALLPTMLYTMLLYQIQMMQNQQHDQTKSKQVWLPEEDNTADVLDDGIWDL